MRAERFLAQQSLGRTLGRCEWVELIDGNPDNLSTSNIRVVTPTERFSRRVYTKQRSGGRRKVA
jgi:hypothetical protein